MGAFRLSQVSSQLQALLRWANIRWSCMRERKSFICAWKFTSLSICMVCDVVLGPTSFHELITIIKCFLESSEDGARTSCTTT